MIHKILIYKIKVHVSQTLSLEKFVELNSVDRIIFHCFKCNTTYFSEYVHFRKDFLLDIHLHRFSKYTVEGQIANFMF